MYRPAVNPPGLLPRRWYSFPLHQGCARRFGEELQRALVLHVLGTRLYLTPIQTTPRSRTLRVRSVTGHSLTCVPGHASLSVCLSTYLTDCVPACLLPCCCMSALPACQPACVLAWLSACLRVYMPVELPECLPGFLYTFLSVSLHVCTRVCLKFCMPAMSRCVLCKYACLPAVPGTLLVCLPATLTACLPACPSARVQHNSHFIMPAYARVRFVVCLSVCVHACLPACLLVCPACLHLRACVTMNHVGTPHLKRGG